MKTIEATFRYPVLGFTPDLDVWGFQDLDTLTSCGPRTLKDNMQIGMELVDADGRRWIVRSVERTGRAQSLFRWLISALMATPQSRIEHELDVLDPVSLSEVQTRVCGSMKASPDVYGDGDESDPIFLSRLEDVRATRTIAEIHEQIGLDSFKAY